eukprot:365089-Chlamydomonas_euryale.AAC.6
MRVLARRRPLGSNSPALPDNVRRATQVGPWRLEQSGQIALHRPRSDSDGWSSGRRPRGHLNRRSSSLMGRSLMLACRWHMYPFESNSPEYVQAPRGVVGRWCVVGGRRGVEKEQGATSAVFHVWVLHTFSTHFQPCFMCGSCTHCEGRPRHCERT